MQINIKLKVIAKSSTLWALAIFFLYPLQAIATEPKQEELMQRIEQIEKNINSVQKHLYDVEDKTAVSKGTLPSDHTEEMQTQIKGLRGEVEQLQFEIANLNDKLVKFSADIEMRFTHITTEKNATDSNKKILDTIDKQLEEDYLGDNKSNDQKAIENGAAKTPNSADQQSIEEQYQRAYSLLTQQKIEEAIVAFMDFISNNPGHKLIGSAHYWLGEAYSAQNDIQKATVEYLKGYQRNTKGPKAPDNLLKLGISLAKLEKKREACITLNKLQKEYPEASVTIQQKRAAEAKRLACD